MNPNDDVSTSTSSELTQLEQLTRWLIQRAARKSPAALSERLEEEWLAHLVVERGVISRLCFALGCCWAMRVIARDYLASNAPASSATTAQGTIILGPHDATYFSRRTTILLLIVCFHAFVIYGFATGFGHNGFAVIPGRARATIFDPPPTQDPLPPPPITSRLPTSPPVKPDVTSPIEFPTDPIHEPPPLQPPPQSPPAATAPAVNRLVGGPSAGFPDTDDYYPLAARRLGQMGVATLRVCVDDHGRLASVPIITHSSGVARLDDAAVQLARAGTGHYRSTTENGIPISDCYSFRVRFQLRE